MTLYLLINFISLLKLKLHIFSFVCTLNSLMVVYASGGGRGCGLSTSHAQFPHSDFRLGQAEKYSLQAFTLSFSVLGSNTFYISIMVLPNKFYERKKTDQHFFILFKKLYIFFNHFHEFKDLRKAFFATLQHTKAFYKVQPQLKKK